MGKKRGGVVMGRLWEAVVEVNRIGRIAFDGDAVTLARFNKDILLRAHKPAPTAPLAQ